MIFLAPQLHSLKNFIVTRFNYETLGVVGKLRGILDEGILETLLSGTHLGRRRMLKVGLWAFCWVYGSLETHNKRLGVLEV
jgi:hypothetical protein